MKAEDIIKFLLDEDENNEFTWDDFLFNDEDEPEGKELRKTLTERFGNYELVYELGGNEGGGDEVVRVYHFKDHNIYVRFGGYYESNDGITWSDEAEEVFPRVMPVVQYFNAEDVKKVDAVEK